MIRVLVAAASPVARRGLEALLAGRSAVAVVGSGSPSSEALAQQIDELAPDVVLLEWIPQDDEEAPTLPARGAGPRTTAMVVLTDLPERAGRVWALRSGARAVLPRDATAEEIVAAVEAAAAGLVVLHPNAVDSVLGTSASPRALPDPPPQALSPRESEILGMLAEGLGNKEIAWRLKITDHTVKFHVSSILTKLNVSTRTEAVALGFRLGLILL